MLLSFVFKNEKALGVEDVQPPTAIATKSQELV